MLNGFLWRLTSDSVLATGSPEARLVFSTFLTRGKTAITPSTYFGAALPGRFCPSFANHFTVGDCWPTRQSPLADLIKDPFVSERVKDYAPLVIDLHADVHPSMQLITRDQLSTEAHKRRTPQKSTAPPTPAGHPFASTHPGPRSIAPSLTIPVPILYPVGSLTIPVPTLYPTGTVDTSSTFQLGPLFGPLWLYCPWSPHRRRRWGFGTPSSNRVAVHDAATYHPILHFVWTFLDPQDRKAATKVSLTWMM
jgi:hypothetical protein